MSTEFKGNPAAAQNTGIDRQLTFSLHYATYIT